MTPLGSVEEHAGKGKTDFAFEEVTDHMGMLDSGGPHGELCRTLSSSGCSPPGIS